MKTRAVDRWLGWLGWLGCHAVWLVVTSVSKQRPASISQHIEIVDTSDPAARVQKIVLAILKK